jgi:hypothetical protein
MSDTPHAPVYVVAGESEYEAHDTQYGYSASVRHATLSTRSAGVLSIEPGMETDAEDTLACVQLLSPLTCAGRIVAYYVKIAYTVAVA